MERGNGFIRTQESSGCGGPGLQSQPSVHTIGTIAALRPAWATEWDPLLTQNKASKQIKPQPERETRLTKKLCVGPAMSLVEFSVKWWHWDVLIPKSQSSKPQPLPDRMTATSRLRNSWIWPWMNCLLNAPWCLQLRVEMITNLFHPEQAWPHGCSYTSTQTPLSSRELQQMWHTGFFRYDWPGCNAYFQSKGERRESEWDLGP